MAKKKKGKRKKKGRFKREPSKLPANRVVSANQYLHLQRQIDEMKMMPTTLHCEGMRLLPTGEDVELEPAR